MRVCLTVDFTNLPKFLSADVVGLVLKSALEKSTESLVGGSRKAKASVSLHEVPQAAEDAPAPVPGKKRGRKPKEVVAVAAAPAADQPDPADAA